MTGNSLRHSLVLGHRVNFYWQSIWRHSGRQDRKHHPFRGDISNELLLVPPWIIVSLGKAMQMSTMLLKWFWAILMNNGFGEIGLDKIYDTSFCVWATLHKYCIAIAPNNHAGAWWLTLNWGINKCSWREVLECLQKWLSFLIVVTLVY